MPGVRVNEFFRKKKKVMQVMHQTTNDFMATAHSVYEVCHKDVIVAAVICILAKTSQMKGEKIMCPSSIF